MKKIVLAVLILLLLALTFPSIPKVSATTEDLWFTPGLPEELLTEPMPENFTYEGEDYLNTTNPYSPGEGNDEEGSRPLYVLVFGDEEERERVRWWRRYAYDWAGWAEMQSYFIAMAPFIYSGYFFLLKPKTTTIMTTATMTTIEIKNHSCSHSAGVGCPIRVHILR